MIRNFGILLGFLLATPTPAALVTRYKFDETSGTAASDSSGNGHHATISADASTLTGAGPGGTLTKCFTFTGTQYVDTTVEEFGGVDLFCEGGKSFTVAFWLKTNGSQNGALVARANNTGGDRTFEFAINNAFAFEPTFRVRGTQTNYTLIDTSNVWTHWAFTWDGTVAKLYKNAVEQTSPSAPGVGSVAEQTGQRIIIGGRNNGADFLLTASSLADVQFHNVALDAAGVQTVRAAGLANVAAAAHYYRQMMGQ